MKVLHYLFKSLKNEKKSKNCRKKYSEFYLIKPLKTFNTTTTYPQQKS